MLWVLMELVRIRDVLRVPSLHPSVDSFLPGFILQAVTPHMVGRWPPKGLLSDHPG